MIKLTWAKTPENKWFALQKWDFSEIKTVGVYHIWCIGTDRKYNVRSGQGIIGARLTAHKGDAGITKHAKNGTLFVTWAEVPADLLDGVERFLADHYKPVEGDRYPDVEPIQATLPGA